MCKCFFVFAWYHQTCNESDVGSTKHLSLLRRSKAGLSQAHQQRKKLKLHENNSFLQVHQLYFSPFVVFLLLWWIRRDECFSFIIIWAKKKRESEEDKNYRVSTFVGRVKTCFNCNLFLFIIIADGLKKRSSVMTFPKRYLIYIFNKILFLKI